MVMHLPTPHRNTYQQKALKTLLTHEILSHKDRKQKTHPSHMPQKPILAPKLLSALRARPVALALDQVDQFGFEGGEVDVAFAAVFVVEGGGFVADEEVEGGKGGGVVEGWRQANLGICWRGEGKRGEMEVLLGWLEERGWIC
jgi:hypothetical protein